jgi:hypothetical protein
MQLARRKELRLAHVRYPFQMLRQVALRKKGRVSASKGEMRKREMQKWDDDDQKELVGEKIEFLSDSKCELNATHESHLQRHDR